MEINELSNTASASAFKESVQKTKYELRVKAKQMAERAGIDYERFNRILYGIRGAESEDVEMMEKAFPGFRATFESIAFSDPQEPAKSTEILLAEAKKELELTIKDRDFWRQKFLDRLE
jgi:transcriptional regulator with XRE-family HTH domain